MLRPLSIISIFLLYLSPVAAFIPCSSRAISTKSLHMKDETGDVKPLDTIPLAFKMTGILAIKTAKDVVNYPPLLLDNALRNRQLQKDDTALPKANPVVMLAKLMGVLVFKTVHDAFYFPALWTHRFVHCQQLDECELE